MMRIDITIHDEVTNPTRLRYRFKNTDDPDQDPYVVFIKGESSVNLHPSVIDAAELLEDPLGSLLNRMNEHSEYIAPCGVREVANVG